MADSLPDVKIPRQQWVALDELYSSQYPTLAPASYDTSADAVFQSKGDFPLISFTSATQPSESSRDGQVALKFSGHKISAGDNRCWLWTAGDGLGNFTRL